MLRVYPRYTRRGFIHCRDQCGVPSELGSICQLLPPAKSNHGCAECSILAGYGKYHFMALPNYPSIRDRSGLEICEVVDFLGDPKDLMNGKW